VGGTAVSVGVAVGVVVGVCVGVGLDVAVAVAVGVCVGVGSDVAVAVAVGVCVGVELGVAVTVGVGVGVIFRGSILRCASGRKVRCCGWAASGRRMRQMLRPCVAAIRYLALAYDLRSRL
jgi:hypothetical protein